MPNITVLLVLVIIVPTILYLEISASRRINREGVELKKSILNWPAVRWWLISVLFAGLFIIVIAGDILVGKSLLLGMMILMFALFWQSSRKELASYDSSKVPEWYLLHRRRIIDVFFLAVVLMLVASFKSI